MNCVYKEVLLCNPSFYCHLLTEDTFTLNLLKVEAVYSKWPDKIIHMKLHKD